MRKSLITLSRQTGLLTSAFNLMLGPVGAVIAIAGMAIAVFSALEEEESKLGRAIIATGNYAGTTVSQVQALGTSIGAQTGRIRDARAALADLAASGKATGDQLGLMGKAAVDFSTVTGESIDKAVQTVEKLAGDPVRAVTALNDQYHFLTLAIYEQITAAEKNGDTQRAASIAEQAFADAFAQRATTVKQNLGYIETALNAAKEAARSFWDKLLDLGREKTFDEQFKDLQKRIDFANNQIQKALDAGESLESSMVQRWVQKGQAAIDAQAKLRTSDEALAEAEKRQAAATEGVRKQIQQEGIEGQATFDRLTASIDKTAAAQQRVKQAADALYKMHLAGGNLPAGISFDGPVADVPVGPGWDKLKAKLSEVSGAARENQTALRLAQQALGTLNQTIDEGVTIADKLANGYRGALGQATNAYDVEINKLALAMDALEAKKKQGLISNEAYQKTWKKLSDGAADAGQQFGEATARIAEQNDVVGNYLHKLDEDTALAGLDDRQRSITRALTEQIDKWQKLTDQERQQQERLGHLNPATEQGAQAIRDATAAAYDHSRALDYVRQAQQQVEHEIAGGFSNAFQAVGNLLTGQIKNFKDFWSSVVDGFKRMVAQIIAQMLQLQFLGPIMQMLGFNGANYGMMAGAGMSLLGGGATPLAQTGASVASSAGNGLIGSADNSSSGSGFSLFSPTTWITAGKSLFSGFQNGFSSLWYGSSGGLANGGSIAGGWSYTLSPVGGAQAGAYGGYSSGFGQALGVAGGIYAGYSRMQNADGMFGKAGGALAYGVGTYYAGAAISSALTGGISAGLAAVPVVGWIAIAAMAVDKISGGKLFGTSYQTKSSTSKVAIDSEGGTASEWDTQSKQKALFGGTKWRTVDIDPGDDARQAANDFFNQIKKTMVTGANALGVDVVPVIAASIQTVTDYDKKGHATATKYLVDVIGRQWTEATGELAAQRVQAEALIAQVDASAGGAATEIAEQWRKDAATLNDGAQLLLAAQVDITKGQALLGDGADLASTVDIVQQLAQSGETMVQTYARLQTETQTLRNALDLTGADIGKTGAEFVRFADAAAAAAGGADQLTQLTQAFASAFYSAEELARQSVENLHKQAESALSGIGLDTSISKADFRAAYEAALPTLTPEQLVQWQQAGVLLAQYTDALQQQADTIKSTLAQMDATAGVVDPNAGTWATTLDSINAQFDVAIAKLKDLGASADDLARAEADRQATIANAQQAAADAYTNIVQQLRDGMAALDGAGQSDMAAQVAQIRAAEQATIDQMDAAAKAAGMEAASEGDLALAHQYANQQITKLASDYLASLGLMGHGTSEFGQSIAAIRAQESQAIDAATALAQAQGREGANAAEVARIHLWAADQIAAAMAKIQAQTQDLIANLYGGPAGTLDAVNAQISALESSMQGAGSAAGNMASSIDNASKAMADQQKLLYGDLSPYNDNQRLDFAKQAYLDGNASSDDVLRIAQRLYSSSGAYKDVFDWVMDNPQQQTQQTGDIGAGGGGGAASNPALDALYKQRDDLQAQAALEQRKAWAEELIQNIADMAAQNHIDALTQMDLLGVKLPDVVKDLGIDIQHLDANGVLGLADVAQTLGVNMGDVLDRLGIGFGDLYTGLVDLTGRMGVDLGNIDATNLQKLADLASVLHISMEDLLTGLHLNLGDISSGVEQMVDKLGIDLSNISADNIESLGALAGSLGLSLGDLAGALHLSLGDLTTGLRDLAERQGIDLASIDANSVQALVALADGLHLSLGDMITALHLDLADVAPGVRDLAAALGINLADLNANSIASLGNLSGQLNTDLGSLATALGLNLKDIAPGLTAIADGLGIDLGALTDADTQKLADLAASLHINLSDLGDLLGVNLDGVAQASQAGLSDVTAALDGGIADLGAAIATSLGDMTTDVGSSVTDMANALGTNLANLDANSIESMGQLSGQLNTDLGSLVTALGLNLKDIAPGLNQIASDMGIDLAALTDSDARQLADLAASLHINLSDLGTALGIDLGAVTQASQAGMSDITAALDGNLADLGAAIAASLGEVTDSVSTAVDGASNSVADMLAATLDRARADDALQSEIAGFTSSNEDQTAVLRSIDGNIAELPAAVRDDGDVIAVLNAIAANTRDGASAASASAANTNSTNKKLDDVSNGIYGMQMSLNGLSSDIATIDRNTRSS
jgi:phage-related minor tail protein